jgi:hypothetical protein
MRASQHAAAEDLNAELALPVQAVVGIAMLTEVVKAIRRRGRQKVGLTSTAPSTITSAPTSTPHRVRD